MVARVAAVEAQPHRVAIGGAARELRRQPHRVTQPEAEHVLVERLRRGIVVAGEHDVAEALLGGDELVAVGADEPATQILDAVVNLEGVVGGILEADHALDLAVEQLFLGAFLERDAVGTQGFLQLLEGRRVGDLPARGQQPVLLAGHDHQTRRHVVHPQVEGVGVGALALHHAEHLEPELAPGRHIGGLDAHVAEGLDRRHAMSPLAAQKIEGQLVELVELL
ncbi:Uncharacterised protein [Mycobacteroides abscessus subsp. abscessus]|nr:Uncharacterised protein [Mycobacteroides abscessus subsp. abscessus]